MGLKFSYSLGRGAASGRLAMQMQGTGGMDRIGSGNIRATLGKSHLTFDHILSSELQRSHEMGAES